MGFIANPLSRTADVVAELGVLAAQVHSWSQLTEEERKIVNEDP